MAKKKEKDPLRLIQEIDSEEEKINFTPIVGIGASAGGLEALKELLPHLSGNAGMAYVVVQHLEPKRESALPEILASVANMPVRKVTDAQLVCAGHIYVIPPNTELTLIDGHLHLSPRSKKRGQNFSIDAFFQSLAKVQRSSAIGVILSGANADGAIGIQAIKSEGGLTFAQTANSAKFAEMPRAAIETGCVDFILNPSEIARELCRIATHPFLKDLPTGTNKKKDISPHEDFSSVIQILSQRFRIDFVNYKQTTLRRRILRRMVLHKIEALDEYLELIKKDAKEVQALYDDILINVTEFFRDSEVFEKLKKDVFPAIIKNKERNEPIRIWVPGCSSGEEVYSLVICLFETLAETKLTTPIQVFGTDISERSIEKARTGFYPESSLAGVSPERLTQFFRKVDGGYKVVKQVREACIFATQNVTGDPPFSKLDLISCRNLLIYLGPILQKKVLPIFHYSLMPTGFLLLGTAETIGGFSDLFSNKDSKAKLFVKKLSAKTPQFAFSGRPAFEAKVGAPVGGIQGAQESLLEVRKEAERVIFAMYAPSAVVINDDFDILHSLGDTAPYLSLNSGIASLNILKMAREGLEVELRQALQRVKKTGLVTKTKLLRVRVSDHFKEVTIEISPLKQKTPEGNYYLVLFKADATQAVSNEPQTTNGKPPTRSSAQKAKTRVSLLEQELAFTKAALQSARETLQTTVESYEAVNEELKSANEEVLSSNEELQSTNEELETSKEEVQSTNEELNTVNDELSYSNVELTRANSDLINIIGSSHIPLVIIGRDLRIRRFTPQAEKALRLSNRDLGRPIQEVNFGLPDADLKEIINGVISELSVRECEIRSHDGKWYLLRVRPYKSIDDKIDGTVISLVDIDLIKRNWDFAQSIVQTVREPLVVLDPELTVISANQAFYNTFNLPKESVNKLAFYELDNHQWNIPSLRSLLEKVVKEGESFENFEIQSSASTNPPRTLMLNARRILGGDDKVQLVLLAMEDVTVAKKAQAIIQNARLYAESVVDTVRDPLLIVGPDFSIHSANEAFYRVFHVMPDETERRTLDKLGNGQWNAPELKEKIKGAFANQEFHNFRIKADFPNLGVRTLMLHGRHIFEGRKPTELVLLAMEDITERLRTEEALRESEERVKMALESGKLGTWDYDLVTGSLNWCDRSKAMCGLSSDEPVTYETFLSCVHPAYRERVDQELKSAIKGEKGGEYSVEYLTNPKSGDERWLAVRGQVYFDEGGKAVRFMGTSLDISDQKYAEERLKRSAMELARSNEDLARFAHVASHDLQEPLRMVTMYVNMLRTNFKGELNKDANIYMGFIVGGTERMKALIDDLLSYSRIDREPRPFENVSSTAILERVLTDLKISIKETGAEIKHEPLPMVKCDPVQMGQLFQNLISNSIKYRRKEASPIIRISCQERDDEHLFTFKDNGLGVDMNHAKLIFEPFRRLHGREYSGTGIGLATCARVVERHGGRIWVESKPGEGSSFHFTISRESSLKRE